VAGATPLRLAGATAAGESAATREPRLVRWALIAFSVAFLVVFLVLPLLVVLSHAFSGGVRLWFAAVVEPDARAAIRLTLLTAAIVVPLSTLFGLAAAWCLGKFEFRGRNLLVTLIDLPFSVSPVVAGLLFVLLFGRVGWLGPWLAARDIQVIFAVPGIVLATLFVTLPFVARELLPLVEMQGTEEEESARLMGAGGLTIFWRVTLPNLRWGLLYGVILCNARAMGEFGAVAVVSGHIRGLTTTLPLQVEALYNEYQLTAAFALASLLAGLAMVTLVAKAFLERRLASHGERGSR
jgi:sulfate/thiosulfate transport system permease protein